MRCRCQTIMKAIWDDKDTGVTLWQRPECGQVKRTEDGKPPTWYDPPGIIRLYKEAWGKRYEAGNITMKAADDMDEITRLAEEIQDIAQG